MNANTRDLLERILPRLKVVRGPLGDGRYVAWCPFHPDGQGKPPHQPNLYVGPLGFICHVCSRKGPLRDLAEHLGVADTCGTGLAGEGLGGDVVATYDYEDEHGELLFQVVRKKGKGFYQRRPDGKGGWINNLEGVRRVPYRLPEFLARPGELVFVVEGEKDVETLRKEKLLATTNPGGAGKWRSEYSDALAGREVIILPDNDEPGRKHADHVARCLTGLAHSVKVVQLPDLPEKGDVSDWLAAKHTVEELRKLVDAAPLWKPSGAEGEGESRAEREEPRPQADCLVRVVRGAGVELFHDERGEPFAAVPLPEGRRIMSLGSRDFHRWLSRLAWTEMSKAVSGEVLAAAQRVLDGIACYEGNKYRLYVRCAWHEGCIWLDLDGVRAVKVVSGRWEIVQEPPILFRSFPHQLALPQPVAGGDLGRVLGLVNLCGADAQLLLLCYLVAAMVPDVPVPALIVHGVQGSAKTTLLKVVKRLLDPSTVEVRGGVRDPAEYAQAAYQNRVLFFDNLTDVRDWLSDALCRTVTGEGYSKRTLYTDEDSTVFEYQRVVGLSGINLVAERADLLDRSLILELMPIPPDQRREERGLWEEFEKARPAILGGILDALAKAMQIAPGQNLRLLPRMADFARWGAAAAEALGVKAGRFVGAYRRNVGRQNEAAVDASPVAQAILAMMEEVSGWEGTPGGLLDRLCRIAETQSISTREPRWPKTPSWVGRRLREVQPNLLAMGIEITEDRTGAHRKIAIRKIREEAVTPDSETGADVTAEPSLGGNAVMDAVTPEPDAGLASDGSDSNDGICAHSSGTPAPSAQVPAEDVQEAVEERTAIMIEDGHVPCEEARRRAAEAVGRGDRDRGLPGGTQAEADGWTGISNGEGESE